MTKLQARLKILVLQGEVDPMHSVESAYNQYNHLLAHGKKKTSLTILKGRGHSFGVRTPEAVDILRDWVAK